MRVLLAHTVIQQEIGAQVDAALWVPVIGVKNRGPVRFQVVEVGVLQAEPRQEFAKISVGDERDAVATLLQADPDADVGVYVARRAVGQKQKVHCGPRRPATLPTSILKSK